MPSPPASRRLLSAPVCPARPRLILQLDGHAGEAELWEATEVGGGIALGEEVAGDRHGMTAASFGSLGTVKRPLSRIRDLVFGD